jgi:outer membrane protein TolC
MNPTTDLPTVPQGRPMRRLRRVRLVTTAGAILLLLGGAGGASGDPQPLTLDQALRTALDRNRTIAGARSEVASAAWGTRRAYANWLPKVEVNGGVTRVDDETLRLANAPIDFIKGMPGIPPEVKDSLRPFAYKDTYSTGFTVLQPIYNGGLELVGIEAARALQERGSHALRDTEQEIASRVKKAYYNVLKAEEMVRLGRETERRTRSYLESIRRKAEAGMRTSADVLRWEAQLASDGGNVVEAENGSAMARAALNEVMGVDLDRTYALEPPPEVAAAAHATGGADTISAASLYDPGSLRRHPGVLATRSLARLQKANLEKAWTGFRPQVNLAFSYNWEKNGTISLDGAKTWATALMLRFPVFSSFGDYASVRQAREDLRKAEFLVEEVERGAGLRARNAALAVTSARDRIAIARKGVEFAEANLQTVTRRYETGVASNIDLIDAQTTAYQARTMLIHATYDAAIARAELERATGIEP